MIVRVAVLCAVVDMTKDAEAELGIFVQHLALRHVIGEIRFNKIIVLQYVLDQRAHFLAPLDSGILLEDRAACRRELFEITLHKDYLLRIGFRRCRVWRPRASRSSPAPPAGSAGRRETRRACGSSPSLHRACARRGSSCTDVPPR